MDKKWIRKEGYPVRDDSKEKATERNRSAMTEWQDDFQKSEGVSTNQKDSVLILKIIFLFLFMLFSPENLDVVCWVEFQQSFQIWRFQDVFVMLCK